MPLTVDVCDAVLEQMNLESGLQQVFARVPDAVFGGDSAYKYIGGIEKLEDLGERLSGIVHAVET